MYRRSKFLELLLEIRREMAEESGYDLDQFVQNIGGGSSEGRASSGEEDSRLNGSELRKAAAADHR